MGKMSAVCEFVHDGDTFRTTKQSWIRLARYDAPKEDKPNYSKASRLLSSLILDRAIEYEQFGTSYNRIVAEVWQGGKNINDIMIRSGY
ncbi:thermonuclease family protein [Chloroflexota bacterium]